MQAITFPFVGRFGKLAWLAKTSYKKKEEVVDLINGQIKSDTIKQAEANLVTALQEEKISTDHIKLITLNFQSN